jgi:Zn-dependent protease with chaperone function
MTMRIRNSNRRQTAATAVALVVSIAIVSAQTKITPPSNKYSVQDDVKLGQDAAREARRQLPLLRDESVHTYVERLGERLVAAIPADLRHPGFQYTFEVVNVRDINAFALPGGPMFVNRGMIEAAKSEGEVAGVMAHEISHVALRHGTAQASKATKYQIGEIIGAVAGAIVGGTAGQVISQGTSFGLGTAFMKYGREYERQADIEGAQIMARAGYDPRDMANMFQTIERQSGGGGPEWLSDHPNPGNRSAYITKEAELIRISNPVRDAAAFDRVKSQLRSMPKAPSTEEVARRNGRTSSSQGGERGEDRPPTGRVVAPSSRYTEYEEGGMFRVSVPSNWRELTSNSSVTFAPDGAHGASNGQNVFTHGIEIGIARPEAHNLREATDELIDALAESNPRLRREGDYRQRSVDGRSGLQMQLSNVSDVTRREETIQLVTTLLSNGGLMYAVAVAPDDEFGAYQPHFQRVVQSIRISRQ